MSEFKIGDTVQIVSTSAFNGKVGKISSFVSVVGARISFPDKSSMFAMLEKEILFGFHEFRKVCPVKYKIVNATKI